MPLVPRVIRAPLVSPDLPVLPVLRARQARQVLRELRARLVSLERPVPQDLRASRDPPVQPV